MTMSLKLLIIIVIFPKRDSVTDTYYYHAFFKIIYIATRSYYNIAGFERSDICSIGDNPIL